MNRSRMASRKVRHKRSTGMSLVVGLRILRFAICNLFFLLTMHISAGFLTLSPPMIMKLEPSSVASYFPDFKLPASVQSFVSIENLTHFIVCTFLCTLVFLPFLASIDKSSVVLSASLDTFSIRIRA